jgi:hypothetical protein
MGAPVPPLFQIHLGLDKAIELDMEYWRKESRRQTILACLLAGGTLLGMVGMAMAIGC